MKQVKDLTRAQLEAINLIGRRRKAGVKIGQASRPGQISPAMFRKLESFGLVMRLSPGSKDIILTYPGEKVFTELHPRSKYRVK